MGLFGGLFDRKTCAICGGEIGLLGNRRLEDGNLCKKCAEKLSPLFSERRHSTVEEIRRQLEYRDMNRQRLAGFHATRVYGENWKKLLIDDNMRGFVVTNSRDLVRDNPDIIDFAMVTDCCPDIRERRREATRKDQEGHDVPFDPRRYDYSYDFHLRILIRSPFFDDAELDLNDEQIPYEDTDKIKQMLTMTEDAAESLVGVRPDLSDRIPRHEPFCRECGRELPEYGARCMFCMPVVVPVAAHGVRENPPRPGMPPVRKDMPAPQPPADQGRPAPERPMEQGRPAPQRPMEQGRPAPQRPMDQGRPMQQKPGMMPQKGEQPDRRPERGPVPRDERNGVRPDHPERRADDEAPDRRGPRPPRG